jgi:hypothetical protein
MPDYSLCKVYKLISNQTDKVYIGSTCQILSRRMASHRQSYKKYLNGKKLNYASFEIVKYPDCKIILVQAYPQCQSNIEQRMFEQDWIDCYDCVNKTRAYISPELAKEQEKEYYQNNKEQFSDYHKKHYQYNREYCLERQKEYYNKNKEQRQKYNREWHEKNKEQRKERDKIYYENNKEQISKKNKEIGKKKVLCECGREVSLWGLSNHKTTQIHKQLLNNLS